MNNSRICMLTSEDLHEISGLVNAQLLRAFYIKHGEIQHPIKSDMISGVVFNLRDALTLRS